MYRNEDKPMLSRILDVFSNRGASGADDAVDEKRVHVATCVLLLEVAHADEGFSPEESAHVRQTLQRRFNLTDEDANELVEAAEEARRDSHDLWRFTSRINDACTPAEKREILREVWRVIYADGELGSHEDHLVHRMATLLNLTHPQLIEEKLAVLKELRGES
jgi:uncharacterized tellurite resistance protein B-like protein